MSAEQQQMYAVPQPYWEDDGEAEAAAAENLSANRSKRELVVCKATDPGVEFIRSDCGTKYLAMRRKVQKPALSTQQMYAEPTPYGPVAAKA